MITRSKKRLLEVEHEIDIINKKTKIDDEEKEKIREKHNKISDFIQSSFKSIVN